MTSSDSYIAALDVGTTTIRCQIINSATEVVGSSNSSVKLIYPSPGFVEINPEQLWEQILQVIKNAIADAQLTATHIKCLGISTQRSTFTTWERDTGKPFHNFITWKDIRAKILCKEINSSSIFKLFRSCAYSLYLVTRSDRFRTGSRLKLASNHVTGRLLWTLRNIPKLKEAKKSDILFGTVDTWLLYKLTNANLHVTDISNAAATGFFDPFVAEWSWWAEYFLGIPNEILPKVVSNDYDFGSTDQEIFGVSIPIKCVMADQSSSMFASCCFDTDDIKVTLGTGAFLDVNTGSKVHCSVTGIYPLIAWKIKDESICLGEVACNDCGSLVQWLINSGFITEPSDIVQIVSSVEDSDGVYFIPAFSGLGPPINNEGAGSGFLGIKPTTTKSHLVRSVMEGIIYRLTLAYKTLQKERPRPYKKVTVDGGVSKNDFVCQMLSDLTGLYVERLKTSELSAMGVAFLAGISMDVWTDREELKRITKNTIDQLFTPSTNKEYKEKCISNFNKWLEAVERFKSWYQTN